MAAITNEERERRSLLLKQGLKPCAGCNEIKPITEFYRDKSQRNGLSPYCKACRRALEQTDAVKEYRCAYAQTDSYKASVAKYLASEKPKLAARRRYRENKDAAKQRQKEWWQTPSGKKSKRRSKRKYAATHKLQERARHAVNYAVEKGRIPGIATSVCHICGSRAECYHHWSYEEECLVDILPLCTACHKKIHRTEQAVTRLGGFIDYGT